MARLFYKTVLNPDKVPYWLLSLNFDIMNEFSLYELSGTPEEFDLVHRTIKCIIRELVLKKKILRSIVEAELRTDDGKTVIHIFRNKEIVETFFIE